MDQTWPATFLFAAVLVACVFGEHAYDGDKNYNGNGNGGVSGIKTQETGSMEDRGRLITDLFQNYDIKNYPVNETLRFGLSLLKFDVDEFKNNIEADVWIKQMWTDTRLKWDPEEYGGHTVLRIPNKDVWKPDTSLYNTATMPDVLQCYDSNVLLFSDGKILWVPACHFRAYCNLTLDVAPYGEQSCDLKFGSWTYDGLSLDLQLYEEKEEADMDDFWDITDWNVISNKAVRVEKTYACCREPYPYISYDFAFQRKGNCNK